MRGQLFVGLFDRFLLHVAFKINSVNELVLTEIVLDNTLGAYEPEEVAISERVAAVQDRHKVTADEHRWTLNFGLMETVYEWAKGMVGICHCRWLNDC